MTRDSCSPLAAAPLNLANSPSLHLLTPAEQMLCSQLRILPKPYLVIKETLVREYARRGGKLRRREARELVKIDVNKTSRVWDFLVQSGYLKITTDPSATASVTPSVSQQDGKCVHISLSRAVPRSTDLYSLQRSQYPQCQWITSERVPGAKCTQISHRSANVVCFEQSERIAIQLIVAVVAPIMGNF